MKEEVRRPERDTLKKQHQDQRQVAVGVVVVVMVRRVVAAPLRQDVARDHNSLNKQAEAGGVEEGAGRHRREGRGGGGGKGGGGRGGGGGGGGG